MLTLILAAAPVLAQSHPFSIHDMLAMRRVSDPEVSPDGRHVLFTVRDTDLEANRGRTDVWLAPVDGGTPRRMTSHEAGDSSARWMPDGKSFVFLSTRSGSSQVWRQNVDGGEAERVTDLPLDVGMVQPFADGRRLLIALEVYPELAADQAIAGTVERDAAREKSKVKARIYESLLFRHWDTWEDGKRSHLFVWEPGQPPRSLMAGFEGDVPTKPFGGPDDVALSPDGRTVVFACLRATRDAAWTYDVNLYSVATAGGAAPVCITASNPAHDGSPAFSPDGKTLAWLRMARAGFESDRQRVAVVGWTANGPAGEPRILTEDWDRSPGEIRWTGDGRTILCSADDVGQHALFAVDAASGAVRKLVASGYNASPRPAGDRILFAQDTLAAPMELFTCARDGADVRRVTDLNAARRAAARTGEFEQFAFTGWNGEAVYGYLVKPVDFDAGRKYPVAFLIHGGPQGSFGNHFHYRWNPQAYAGAGYAAVMIDFHGSTGYGQAFTDSIRDDWGGKPYEDLMKGLDAALARYPFLDGARVAALGASYGGYMINWIAGQTDRFRCLVNHDGNLDERMAYYDTEELWFPEWERGGPPWEHPEAYARHNPIDHVEKWSTPMLVIHGALDFRVVDTQGMSTFTALQRRGIPSKFLWFPDENHWVLKPQNSILWHETVLGWLDRWTGNERGAAVPAGSGR